MNASVQRQIDELETMNLPTLQAKYAEVVGEPNRSPNKVFLKRRITERLMAAEGGEPAATVAEPATTAAFPAVEPVALANGEPAATVAEPATTGAFPAVEPVAAEGAEPVATAAALPVADDGAVELDDGDLEDVEVESEEDDESGDIPGTGEDEAVSHEGDGEEATMTTETDTESTTEDTAPTAAQDKPLSQCTVPQLRKMYVKEVGRPTSSVDKAYLVWKIREARKGRVPVGPRRERGTEPGDFMVLPFRLETRTVKRLDQAWKRHDYSSRSDFLRAAVRALMKKHGEAEVAALFEAQG